MQSLFSYSDDDVKIQVALTIRGFVIHGFDCPQLVNCVQNWLPEDISLGYPRILPFFNGNMDNKMPKQLSFAILGFGICAHTKYPDKLNISLYTCINTTHITDF
jgi:hypothetical protein